MTNGKDFSTVTKVALQSSSLSLSSMSSGRLPPGPPPGPPPGRRPIYFSISLFTSY